MCGFGTSSCCLWRADGSAACGVAFLAPTPQAASIRARHHRHAITHATEIDLVAIVQLFSSFDAVTIDIGAVARMQVLDHHRAVGTLQFAVFSRYHRMEYLVIAMARTS